MLLGVAAWLTWSIAAFVGARLPLLDLRTPGGPGAGLVWLMLVGPLFALTIAIGARLLGSITLAITVAVLRRLHRVYDPYRHSK
jgi:hypothetical protein